MKRAADLQIAADHPSYAGHFPGEPILPGVVLLDAVLRAIDAAQAYPPCRWQIATAKFQMIVRPGDALRVEHQAGAQGSVSFTVLRGAEVVAGGKLTPG